MNRPARFLLLLGAARRALLFDVDRRLLGEVIEDDGFIVDSLTAHATTCSVPDARMLRAIVPSPAPSETRCFDLG